MSRRDLEFKGGLFETMVATEIVTKIPTAKILFNKELFSPFLQDTTQIDLICITEHNVFVIEAKGWNSYIKGSYCDKHWSGRGKGGTMSVFNTVNQNAIHIRALKAALFKKGYKDLVQFRSLIVVPNECQILTDCKEVCSLNSLCTIIKRFDKMSENIDMEYYTRIIHDV